ncbi:hypothetical protein, partial [Mycobacterium tuberculosis]|uniref:hypothetical protein n=1 Tax=Mycobacterium tuberculosis TaxID=1773 RepID=UPI0032B49071
TSFSLEIPVFNHVPVRGEAVFAFIVKRFRVFRAPLQLPAQRTHRIRAANFAALRPWPGLTVEIRKSAPAQ